MSPAPAPVPRGRVRPGSVPCAGRSAWAFWGGHVEEARAPRPLTGTPRSKVPSLPAAGLSPRPPQDPRLPAGLTGSGDGCPRSRGGFDTAIKADGSPIYKEIPPPSFSEKFRRKQQRRPRGAPCVPSSSASPRTDCGWAEMRLCEGGRALSALRSRRPPRQTDQSDPKAALCIPRRDAARDSHRLRGPIPVRTWAGPWHLCPPRLRREETPRNRRQGQGPPATPLPTWSRPGDPRGFGTRRNSAGLKPSWPELCRGGGKRGRALSSSGAPRRSHVGASRGQF